MAAEPAAIDRRQRRRQETIEEVLDTAVEIMREQGVAGLSIGEIARRIGIRPPSLYVYFDSKNALYDALFARGARDVLAEISAHVERLADDDRSLDEILLDAGRAFVRWSIEHPAYTQLLFWRPVPGFTPSTESYAPAVELVALVREQFCLLQELGLIRADAVIDEVQRDWMILTSGVISQQMSNAPDEPFTKGRFAAALPGLVAMFARHYAASNSATRRKKANNARKSSPRR